jgi:hypothetical protein
LRELGFSEVETKTHAIGFNHPALGRQLIYLKDRRSHLAAKREATRKQPLVLHPDIQSLAGFERTRVAALSPNRKYMNSNLSTFPIGSGPSKTGIAVDIEDMEALRELLELMGLPSATPATSLPPKPSQKVPMAPASRSELLEVEAPVVSSPAAPAKSTHTYTTCAAVDFAEHCCQGSGHLDAGSFGIDDLTMATEGRRRLRFAPLGNRPVAPRLALVGITPGGQIERFASLLATESIEVAARKAAFDGAQSAIKQLLAAHGFAERIGVSLDGDLNENPGILTTSVVKCCLMVDDGYRFAAPDIAASPAATRCATERLIGELCSYSTLRWVVVFGKPAWDALHELRIDGRSVMEALRTHGLVVVQFPHFAQNFQQRALFACDVAAEASLLVEKPDYAKYAMGSRSMRDQLLAELEATRHAETFA